MSQIEFSENISTPAGAPPASIMERGCGCSFEGEADGPMFAVRQCSEHAAHSAEVERELEMRLGYELDELVTAACQGRKLERIRPVDHTKR